MKGMRFLVPLWALVLTACGSGSVQSPDFTSELKGLNAQQAVTGSTTATAAAGQTVQFEAVGLYTTPPGSDSDTKQDTTSADWSSADPTVATIDSNGLATAVSPGTTTILAAKGDFKGQATLIVTEAAVVSLAIARADDTTQTGLTSDTIPRGSQRVYSAIATLSNGAKVPAPASWFSSNEAAVLLSPTPPDPTATKVLTVPSNAAVGDASVVTASTTGFNNQTIQATLSITVSGATLTGALKVTLNPASPIPINSSTQATATGTYSDGSTAPVANSSIAWTTSTPSIATVDGNGKVTTLTTQGTTDVTATLLTGSEPQVVGAGRTASTSLLVTGTVCTSPLLDPAQVTTTISPLCIGCSLDQPDNLVDASPDNYAQANITVGLLTLSSVSVDVQGTTLFPGGANTNAGFIVGHAAGQLVAAELLSQVTLTTLLNGQPTTDTTSTSNFLVLDLLGASLIGGSDQALLSVASTKPFNGLRLTYSGGLLTALSGLQIYSACGTTAPPAP
jgi:hypothetical protein